MVDFLDGIDLDDRPPVGAQLMAGLKKPSGQIDPSTTNRFWIGQRVSEGAGRKAVRPLHPSFGAFNRRDVPDESRQMIRCRLCHVNVKDSCLVQRSAWDLPSVCPGSPDFPACTGDSTTARRLRSIEAGSPVYEEISCPGRRCEFAQEDGPCSPSAWLYFRPEWRIADESWPKVMMVWKTHGRHSVEQLLGLFNLLAQEAAALGLMPNEGPYLGDDGRQALARHEVPVMGLPLELQLAKRSSRGRKVTTITVTALATFADAIAERRRALADASLPDYRLLPGARSDAEHEARLVADDDAAITSRPVEIPRGEVVEGEVVEEGGEGEPVEAGPVTEPPTEAPTPRQVVDAARGTLGGLAAFCERLHHEIVTVPSGIESSASRLEEFLGHLGADNLAEAAKIAGYKCQ